MNVQHIRTTEGLSRENARLRRERRAALDALAVRKQVLHEYQLEAVEHRIAGRLLMEDFETFIKLEYVLDQDGRIDEWTLEQHVELLLQRRPRLALEGTRNVSGSAVESGERNEARSGTSSFDG